MRPRAKWRAGAALLLAAVGAWTWWPNGWAFDPVAWRDEKQIVRGTRLKMADRIVASGMLRGKTRAEVVEMLGEPPKTGYFRSWDMVYWLGPERGFMSIDSEWLVVKLDVAGNVSGYRIVRD